MIGWINWMYASWIAIPLPIRKAIQGAIVSYQFSMQTMLASLFGGYIVLTNTTHQPVTLSGFISFIQATWFATLVGLIAAGYRARQGFSNAKAIPFQPDSAPGLQLAANEAATKEVASPQ